jgi:nucleoside-diphosphate-sugar epimerase
MMINKYRDYLEKYALPKKEIDRIVSILNVSDVHILGGTGALGLSFLKIINIYKINIKNLTVYIRSSSDLEEWNEYSSKYKINIKYIYYEENIEQTNLVNITNKSTVLYFIGSAQPQKFMKDPQSLFQINIELLRRIVKKSPKYIFYTSTSEIYTGIKTIAIETSPTVSTPQHPRGAYIEAKRCGEAILSSMTENPTRSVSFRVALATPPSPLKEDNRILADLINLAKNTNTVKLKGGWNSVRQYQWGPSCILKILWAGYFGKEILYNIAGGELITLEELAKKIAIYYSVNYHEQDKTQFDNMGAPDFVEVSSIRLQNEIGIKLSVEPIEELIKILLIEKK